MGITLSVAILCEIFLVFPITLVVIWRTRTSLVQTRNRLKSLEEDEKKFHLFFERASDCLIVLDDQHDSGYKSGRA